MNFAAVLATLFDLPSPFTRQTAWFTQLMDALAYEISLETNGADDIISQVLNFNNATDGWIDIYGLLFGIPRNQGEGSNPYAARIQETVLAWVGTLPAIQVWINLFAPGGTVTQNGPHKVGYNIALPAAMTNAQVLAFLISLGRIRPDGVPFTVTQGGGSLYLGTIEFIGLGRVFGSYLTSGASPETAELSAVTLSSTPILATTMLSDPILNPSLAPTAALP